MCNSFPAVLGQSISHRHSKCNQPLTPFLFSHIHVSIRDKQGRNIFALSDEEIKAGGRADAKWKDTKYISKEAEYFLAGILDGLADGERELKFVIGVYADLFCCALVMPLLCPNINSYKRLVGGEAGQTPNPQPTAN